MAVTIKTDATAWYEDSGDNTIFWSANVVHDTGSALYAVVQDGSGGSPKVRVLKADSRTAPTAWTEQDAANNKTISNGTYSYASSYDVSTGIINVGVFTDATTVAYHRFDTASDSWTTGKGSYNGFSRARSIRVMAGSGSYSYILGSSSADDADIRLAYHLASWSVLNLASLSSSQASTVAEFVRDSTDRLYAFWYDCASDDFSYRSFVNVSSFGTTTDIDDTIGGGETDHASGARFGIYDDSGTEKLIAAYIDFDGTLRESVITLESDSTSGNVASSVAIESTATDVGVRTPVSTAVISGTPYAAWWDDASSGTIKYSTKVSGTWQAETDFATGVTNLIEIVPVDTGLMVVYQSGSNVVMDWIVEPVADVTVNGSNATASALANSGSKTIDIQGSNATASALANAGTVKVGYEVLGSNATASALANSGALAIDLTGALATASANAYTGQLSFAPAASLATATALANAGKSATDIQGSLATASALANASTVAVDIMGSNATATAEAFFGTQEVGVKINGSLATASAQAFSGTTQEVTGDTEERSGYFQLRPILDGSDT